MELVIGIDPSLTGTAVVIYGQDGEHRAKRIASKSNGKAVRGRNERYLYIIKKVIDFIGDIEPTVICIEGYSYGSSMQNYLAEFGGLLRSDLCVYESAEIHEVAPSTLKKFVTGKGNADKIAVVTQCINRWRCGFATDDEYDAYGLARIAACISGMNPPETLKQAECLKTITHLEFEVGVNHTSPQTLPLPF